MHINGVVSIDLKNIDPQTTKPVLLVSCRDVDGKEVQVALTANIGEMIGGAARGVIQRWQENQPRRNS